MTKNLTQGAEGIQVKNLTENHAGCLHDYTLTTKDMKLLEQADLIVLNGGGMEAFLEELLYEQEAHWNVVDASEGLSLLEGIAHVHGEEPEHIDEEEADVHEEETEHTHTHGENPPKSVNFMNGFTLPQRGRKGKKA